MSTAIELRTTNVRERSGSWSSFIRMTMIVLRRDVSKRSARIGNTTVEPPDQVLSIDIIMQMKDGWTLRFAYALPEH